MFQVEELWTQDDQYALDLCIGAVARGDLDRALLSVEGAEHAHLREAERTLSDWGEGLDAANHPPEAQADALRGLLVDQLGFTGDEEQYHHPRNSSLSAVLQRRRGLPILLSGVWMIVGRHAGIPVAGIGLPGHFIIRVGGERGVYVDPFRGGAPITEADCRRTVEEHASGALDWRESFLDPVDAQAFIARVCLNLVATHNHRQEVARLYRVLRFLEAMRPDDPDIPMMRAEAAISVGALPRALRICRVIAKHYPDTTAADKANETLHRLSRLTVAEG